MKVTKTKIEDVLIIEPDVFQDARGWFFESYNKDKFKALGINIDFVQDNQSFCKTKGTLRGLHFQKNPHAQTKLVSCTRGSVLDVVVDLRKNSKTFKEWFSIELTEENKKQLLIPKGFAHGFLSLTDNVCFQYNVDTYYNKESDRNIRFNDPEIKIFWGNDNPILSEKDNSAPNLKDSDINF